MVSQGLKVATILLAILAGMLSLGMGKLGAGKQGQIDHKGTENTKKGREFQVKVAKREIQETGSGFGRAVLRAESPAEHRLSRPSVKDRVKRL